MKITISGKPGAGKTTVGKIIAKKLGYKFVSIGILRRKFAKMQGMSIEELNQSKEETDRKYDEYQKDFGENNDNFVLDGRMSFYFVPDSVKIFLDVDLSKSIERIYGDKKRERNESKEELAKLIEERLKEDKKRFMKKYGKDIYDKKNYDFWIDTTDLSIEDVSERILSSIKNKLLKQA